MSVVFTYSITGMSTYTVSHSSGVVPQFSMDDGSAGTPSSPVSSLASTQSSHPSFNHAVWTHPLGAY